MCTRLKGRFSLLLLSFAVVMLIFPAMAFAQDAGGSPSPAPTIQSDKADYSPGDTVTLTGSNWQPGESVNINVNDDEGQTWNRNVDVTADDNGQIQDQFQLPDWFVAKYSVKATGANGAVATTTFTDANLKVRGTFAGSTTDSYTLTYQRFSGAACGGTLRSGDTPAPTQTVTSADFTVPPAGQNSAQLTAPATSAGGRAFINWTDSDGNIVPDTVVTGGGHRICADFPPGGTDKTYKANYGAANQAPLANSQSVTTNEDTAKTITLTGSDADGNNLTFAITAGPSNGTLGSIGTVTCTGTAPKNCSADVTYTPNSNFNGSDSFKFRVNDGTVNSSEATVSITVNAVNDAPSISLPGPPLTYTENDPASIIDSLATASDPDSANFDTGKLTVDYLPGTGTADDRLEIRNQGTAAGQIGVSGSDVTFGGTTIGTFTGGSGTTPLVITFNNNATPAAAQALMRNITYRNVSDAPSPAPRIVRFVLTDGDGGTSNAATKPINVIPVNDAPVNSVPGAQSTNEDTALTFNSANSNLVSISDVDAGNNPVQVRLEATNGKLTLSGTSGLTFASGDSGASDSDMTFTGTIANINSALSGLKFDPDANYNGPAQLKITTNDQGNTGTGGAKSDIDTVSITVNAVNDAPVAANNSYSVNEDGELDIAAPGVLGNDSDIDSANLTAVPVDDVAHGTLTLNADGSFTYTPATNYNGPDSFTYKANDGSLDSNVATVSITVNAVNDPPTANAGGPYQVNEGDSVPLDGSGSDPDQGDTLTYDWDLDNNGSFETSGENPSFSAANIDGPATRTVVLRVTDNQGATNTSNATVIVDNVAPSIHEVTNSSGPINEGSSATITVSADDPAGANDPLSYSFDCNGDGDYADAGDKGPQASNSASCSFADNGAYTVNVRVTDGDGGEDTGSTQVTVANVAPTVTLQGPNEVDESATAERLYTFTVTDPGPDDDGAVIDKSCGLKGQIADGSYNYDPQTGEGSFRCIFPDGDATSEVSVKATDKDGGSDADSEKVIIVQIANVNPTIDSVVSESPINEGSSSTITVNASDPGDPDPLSYSFDCNGDGDYADAGDKGPQASNSASCSFADNGTYTVNVRVTDGDGGEDTGSTQVTVNNVAPEVTAAADQASDEGENHAFSLGSFSDAGANDNPWSVDVDWGDGSPHTTFNAASQGALGSQSHKYTDSGSYTVNVKVTDKDGDSDTKSFTVNVANVAPTVSFTGGPTTVDENKIGSETYTFSVSDPGADGFTVASGFPECGTGGSLVANSLTTTASGGSFQCRFSDGPASPTVRIQVRDADEPTGSNTADSNIATRGVTVNNVAPKVNLSGPNTADEGSQKTYTFTLSDPGDDTFAFVSGPPTDYPTCGQYGQLVGTPTVAGGSFECSFPDGPNATDVAIKIKDDDGGISAPDVEHVDIIAVQIANVPPSVTAPANQSSNEGENHAFSLGSFTDPGPDSPWAVDVDWGDGSPHTTFNETATGAVTTAKAVTAQFHTYGDNGSYTVAVKVTDKNGGTDTKSFTVTVNNVAPTASNGTFVFNPILGTATAGFDFSDVGFLDTHSASYFTWSGVGDPGNRPASVTEENVAPDATGHASDTRTLIPGCYPNMTVTGTAVDDDGGSSAPLPLYSSNTQTSVHGKAFRPPIMDNERNISKYGNVVPVKVQLTNSCTGGTDTNVTLYITLAKGVGDEAIEDNNVIAGSVSSADSGSQMRVVDGMYMFNLSTKSLSANTNWTVRVRLGSTTGPVLLQAVLYPKK